MNVLDVAQNSVAAGAKLVQITLEADQARGILSLVIEDDGRGMTPEAAQRAGHLAGDGGPVLHHTHHEEGRAGAALFENGCRNDRRRPFHSIAARLWNARVRTVWPASYRPRPHRGYGVHHCGPYPVQPGHRFRVYRARGEFCADTREMRAVLGGVPLSEPSVAQWIREFIEENTQPILEGVI